MAWPAILLRTAPIGLATALCLSDSLAAAPDAPGTPSCCDPALESLAPVYDHGAVLLDDRAPVAERVAAAASLAATADPRVLPLLRAGARDADPDVQAACLAAAASLRHVESVEIARWVVTDAHTDREVKQGAVEHLGAMDLNEAGTLLWEIAGDRAVPGRVRTHASAALTARYPDLAAALGRPRIVSEPLGATVGVAANGLLGGVLLGSVGSWGKYEGGTTIGAVGGSAVGASTGVLYALGRPVTNGQGLTYGTGVGWGLMSGYLAGNAVLGGERWLDDPSDRERRADLAPLFHSVGVGLGAAVAGSQLHKDPDPWDVVEVDIVAYLGSALALAVVDVAVYRPPVRGERPDPLGELGKYRLRNGRVRAATTLGGAALGLGAGLALSDAWSLDVADGAFAGMVAAEAAWIGNFWPAAFGIDDTDLKGTIRLPLHAAVVGGLALAERTPVPIEASVIGLYGGLTGNALGGGLPMLANREDKRTIARVMLPVGLASTITTTLAAPWLAPDAGDWAMMGIGLPIALGESAAIGAYLGHRGVLDDVQVGGLIATTGGLTGLTLLTVGHWADPSPGDMVLMGSTTVWGAWFGALAPLALDLGWHPSEVALSSALTADVFLLASGAMIAPFSVIEPRDTIVPQIAGLAGGTVGALTASLASGDDADVSVGALVGSAVGLGVGAVTTWALHRRDRPAVVGSPVLNLPGRWTPLVSPRLAQDGTTGLSVGLVVDGW